MTDIIDNLYRPRICIAGVMRSVKRYDESTKVERRFGCVCEIGPFFIRCSAFSS